MSAFAEQEPTMPKKQTMRRPRRSWWRLLAAGFALFFGTVAAILTWLYLASQQVPEFYIQAVEIPATKAAEQGERLERAVLQLQNEVRRDDQFQMTFTADEINGWLASDLVEKFPKALPPGVQNPRVALEPRTILLAFRYDQGVQTVLTLAFEPLLLAEENQLAIRVRQVKAGAVSVPLGPLLEEIAKRAQAAKIPLRWEQDDGVPTAIIPLRFLADAYRDKHVVLETLAVETEKITVAGRTIPVPTRPRPAEAE